MATSPAPWAWRWTAAASAVGKRSQRYAMIVDNGVVKGLNVEEPGAFAVSSAEHVLGQL